MTSKPLPFLLRQRLGHAQNCELAAEANCAAHVIDRKAEGIGISNSDLIMSSARNIQSKLSPDIINMLGTISDRQLARQTGRAESTIRSARTARGIEPAKSDTSPLSQVTISLLGTMSDSELARRSGRSENTIRSARVRRGIARYSRKKGCRTKKLIRAEKAGQTNQFDASLETLCLLSYAPDRIVVERLSLELEVVKTLRAAYAMAELNVTQVLPVSFFEALGSQPDLPIAERFCLDVGTIRRIRQNLKISAYRKLDSNLSPQIVSLLGKVPDSEIAKLSCLSRTSIRKAREGRGIAAFSGNYKGFRKKPKTKIKELSQDQLPELDQEAMTLMAWCSDMTLANHLGIPKWEAIQLREQHGMVKLCLRKKPPQQLFNELGAIPDLELEKKYGINNFTLRTIRRNLKIPAYKSTNSKITETVIAQLGTMSDVKLADLAGVTERIIYKERIKRGIPPFAKYGNSIAELIMLLPISRKKLLDLLWWASDTQISELLGITPYKVKQIRNHLGVQSLNLRAKPPKDLLTLLGREPDTEIAKRFKCKATWVRSIRVKLNIKQFRLNS